MFPGNRSCVHEGSYPAHEWLDHHFSENRVDWAGEGRMGLIHRGGDVIEADMKETRCRNCSRSMVVWILSGLMIFLVACSPSKPKTRIAAPQRAAASEMLDRYTPETIGQPIEGTPWIGHVKAVDLDRDGRVDVIACESRENVSSMWLRQLEMGVLKSGFWLRISVLRFSGGGGHEWRWSP